MVSDDETNDGVGRDAKPERKCMEWSSWLGLRWVSRDDPNDENLAGQPTHSKHHNDL